MPVDYEVSQGDSLPSISKQFGFFFKTLWNHGNNSSLKQKRKNPNVLYPGDKVHIPDLSQKKETRGADAKHKFRRKGVPVELVLQLMINEKPRANEPYILKVGDKELKGNTDGDGILRQKIPNEAKEAMLTFTKTNETFPIQIGSLDPVDEINGVQQRLFNLGYDCTMTGEVDEATVRAISLYQAASGLEVTGKMDQQLKDKLTEENQ